MPKSKWNDAEEHTINNFNKIGANHFEYDLESVNWPIDMVHDDLQVKQTHINYKNSSDFSLT